MATTPTGTDNPERLAAITQLFRGVSFDHTKSFNSLRIGSLCRDPSQSNCGLFSLFTYHLLPQAQSQKELPNSKNQALDIVVRDFLKTWRGLGGLLSTDYFMRNPQRKDTAVQIIQEYCNQLEKFESEDIIFESCRMIRNAERLNKPELDHALLIKLIELPDSNPQTHTKIPIFIRYASDERVKEAIEKFAQELHAQHWTDSDSPVKKEALRLFLRTGTLNNETFKNALTELPIDAWGENARLVEDLFTYGFEEEGKKLLNVP
jgi:hypothetical protein